MVHKLKIAGWFLIGLGLLGVFTPHILFLFGAFPDLLSTLDDPSHSYFEIASGISIIIGFVLVMMGMMMKRR